MKIKQNIGILNALVRITAGLTILSWSTAKLVKKPWRDSYLFIAFLGAMKVGEGIVRYCPVTDLVQKTQEAGADNQPERQNHESQSGQRREQGQEKSYKSERAST